VLACIGDDVWVEEERARERGSSRVARARIRRGALIYATRARQGCLQGGRAGANNSLASGSRSHPLLWFFHHHPRSCLPPRHCCGYLPRPSRERERARSHCRGQVACSPACVERLRDVTEILLRSRIGSCDGLGIDFLSTMRVESRYFFINFFINGKVIS